MAIFRGSKKELRDYFIGYLIAKKHRLIREESKLHNDKCIFCNNRPITSIAGVKSNDGKFINDQNKIVDSFLNNCIKEKGNYIVDLDAFEKDYLSHYIPINRYYHFLCYECSDKYDKGLISENDLMKIEMKGGN